MRARSILGLAGILAGTGVVATALARPLVHALKNPYRGDPAIETYKQMTDSLETFVKDRNKLLIREGIVTPYDHTPQDKANLQTAYALDQTRLDAFNALISRQEEANKKYLDENPVITQNKEWITQGAEMLNPTVAFPYIVTGAALSFIGFTTATAKRRKDNNDSQTQTD